LIGLDRGSNVSWSNKITIICLAVALPLFLAFIVVEIYVAPEPFAPGHIIFERSLVAAYLCNFFSLAGWLAAFFYIPLHFQAVYGLSATQASVLLIPSIICGVLGSLFAGFYMQKTGHYYWLTLICYLTLVAGMLLIVIFSGAVVQWIPGMVIGTMINAFSNGNGITSSLIAIISNSAPEDQAVATACSYLFRSMGGVVGLAISATAVNQMLRATLEAELTDSADAEKIARMVRRSLDSIKTLEPAVREIVKDCYARSTRLGFEVEAVIVLGAAISAVFIKETMLKR
jgi:predicted MFS family arabinose efflux permease